MPHFDHCDVIYHIPDIIDLFVSTVSLTFSIEGLENIQYQGVFAITGLLAKLKVVLNYNEELGWESLSDRRWARRLVNFYR